MPAFSRASTGDFHVTRLLTHSEVQLAKCPKMAFGGVRNWPTCTERPLQCRLTEIDELCTRFTWELAKQSHPPSLAKLAVEIPLSTATSFSRFRSLRSASGRNGAQCGSTPQRQTACARMPSSRLDAHGSPVLERRRNLSNCANSLGRVPVGELAIGESEPDGQTPASAETRQVLPSIHDEHPVGLSGWTSAGDATLKLVFHGPPISEWKSIIDRDRLVVALTGQVPSSTVCAELRRCGVPLVDWQLTLADVG